MCLVDIVTFPACGHKEYLFASACSAGYSHEQNRCTVNFHEIRALIESAPGDFYCRTCYFNKLGWLRDGYSHSYLNVIKDAQYMGWTKQDIQGSLTDIEIEMCEEAAKWKLECDRDEGLDDPKQYLHDKAALLSLFSTEPSGLKVKKSIQERRRQNSRNTKQNTMHTKAKAHQQIRSGVPKSGVQGAGPRALGADSAQSRAGRAGRAARAAKIAMFYDRQQQREAPRGPPINASECALRAFDSARKVLTGKRT